MKFEESNISLSLNKSYFKSIKWPDGTKLYIGSDLLSYYAGME